MRLILDVLRYIKTDISCTPLCNGSVWGKRIKFIMPYEVQKSPVRCGAITGNSDGVLSIRPIGTRSMQNGHWKCIFFHAFNNESTKCCPFCSGSNKQTKKKYQHHLKQIATNTAIYLAIIVSCAVIPRFSRSTCARCFGIRSTSWDLPATRKIGSPCEVCDRYIKEKLGNDSLFHHNRWLLLIDERCCFVMFWCAIHGNVVNMATFSFRWNNKTFAKCYIHFMPHT